MSLDGGDKGKSGAHRSLLVKRELSSAPTTLPAWSSASLQFQSSPFLGRRHSMMAELLSPHRDGLSCSHSLQSLLLASWAREISNKGGTQVWWGFFFF